jgi:hypothetical protein
VLITCSGYACSVIATVLLQCEATEIYNIYRLQIPITIFINLSYWFLLFVVVFTLNTMLRQQLGYTSAIYKGALIAIVGLMGALTCGKIGLSSYINWSRTEVGWSRSSYNRGLILTQQQYNAAYYSLYLVSVLVAGGLALMSITSLRSRRSPAGVSHSSRFRRWNA